MAAPTPQVLFYADVSGVSDGFIILDDSYWGTLDGPGVLAGDIATDVTPEGFACTITRGRNRAIDVFSAGRTTIAFRNRDRTFDPTHVSGPYYFQLVPGKQFDIIAGGVLIFRGVSRDWSYDYGVGTPPASTATVQVVDGLGVLAGKELAAHTASSQPAGDRIDAVLSRSEVRFVAPHEIDGGVETLQADAVAEGTNVLSYLQEVARSDQGRLFANRENVIIYRDRRTVFNTEALVTFSPDEFGIRYHGFGLEVGATFLYNRVTVTRPGGTAQVAENLDAAEENGLGVLALTVSTLLNSDARALILAEALLNTYTSRELRIREVVVKLEDANISDDEKAAVLSLDFGDRVRVRFAPDGVNTDIDLYGIVEGIQHSISPGRHQVTLSLSAVDQRVYLQLDHETYGTLDGPGVLAF